MRAEAQSGIRYDRPNRNRLFDSYGVPWTAHLSLGWTFFFIVISGNLLALPLGIYLGLWLAVKRRSGTVLLIYLLLTGGIVALCLQKVPGGPLAESIFIAVLGALWFLGAFVLRSQVMTAYREAEGTEFYLSLFLTALLTVWYVNYRLRPEWPV